MANRFFEDEKITEYKQSEENNAWAAVRKEQKDREESFWDQAKISGFSTLQMEASLFLENLHGRNVSTNLFVCQKRSVEDSSRLVQSKYFDYLQVPLDFGKFDSYVSINNFKPKGRRTKADCTQINGFFFDMDCHDLEQEEIDVRIKRTLQALNCAVNDQVLPLPTMTTNSGRGLGVFFLLEDPMPINRFTTDHAYNQYASNYAHDRYLYSGENDHAPLEEEMGQELLKDKKKIGYYRYLYTELSLILKGILVQAEKDLGPVLELDGTSINDIARICRIPGSWNTKAGRYCRLLTNSGKFWSLKELDAYIPEELKEHKKEKAAAEAAYCAAKKEKKEAERVEREEWIRRIEDGENHADPLYHRANRNKILDAVCQIKIENPKASIVKISELSGVERGIVQEIIHIGKRMIYQHDLAYDDWAGAFQFAKEESYYWQPGGFESRRRMEKLEELQKLRDYKCEGYRNNMCYVYALSMRNITPDLRKIRQKVEEFNARFQPALSKDALELVFQSVLHKTYTPISNAYVIRVCNITKEEQNALFFHEDSNGDSQDEHIQFNAKKKSQMEAQIVELLKKENPRLAYTTIAEMVGCSRRKVVSIAHRNGIYRYEHSGIISKSDLPVGKQGEDKNSPDSIKNKCKTQTELIEKGVALSNNEDSSDCISLRSGQKSSTVSSNKDLSKPLSDDTSSNLPADTSFASDRKSEVCSDTAGIVDDLRNADSTDTSNKTSASQMDTFTAYVNEEEYLASLRKRDLEKLKGRRELPDIFEDGFVACRDEDFWDNEKTLQSMDDFETCGDLGIFEKQKNSKPEDKADEKPEIKADDRKDFQYPGSLRDGDSALSALIPLADEYFTLASYLVQKIPELENDVYFRMYGFDAEPVTGYKRVAGPDFAFSQDRFYSIVRTQSSGFILFRGRKYSIPFQYWVKKGVRSQIIYAVPDGESLHLFDSEEQYICSHPIKLEQRSRFVIDPRHFDSIPDYQEWYSPMDLLRSCQKKYGVCAAVLLAEAFLEDPCVMRSYEKMLELYSKFGECRSRYYFANACRRVVRMLAVERPEKSITALYVRTRRMLEAEKKHEFRMTEEDKMYAKVMNGMMKKQDLPERKPVCNPETFVSEYTEAMRQILS